MVRDVAADREPGEGRVEAEPQRRFLFRVDLLHARHPDRPVHADFCGQPDLRMDRALPRAVREQSIDPAPYGLHRAAISADGASTRPAIVLLAARGSRLAARRFAVRSTVFHEFRVLQDHDSARFQSASSQPPDDGRYRFASIHDTPKPTSVAASMDTMVMIAMRMYPSPIMSPPVGRIPVRTGM
jgi:hypothetical protein